MKTAIRKHIGDFAAILGLILITTVREAWPAFDAMGLRFITERVWDPNPATGDAIFGALSFSFFVDGLGFFFAALILGIGG